MGNDMSLPTGNQTFIAYGKAPSAEILASGETMTIRPQIYVRFYSAIKIADIVEGGRGGGNTVAVHFDPESVGLTSGFAAYLEPDDPAVAHLTAKWQAGQPVQIGIENIRKKKNSKSKEPLSNLLPIHALRGAKPDGTGADMGTSGANIRNVIALVDGHATKTNESDIAEWAQLANNKQGALAPVGWKPLVAGGEEWQTLGAIVKDEDAPAAPGAPADMTPVLQAIAKLSSDLLNALQHGGSNPADTGADISRRIQPGVFKEGKQWEMRTSDGRFNLGSYLAARYRLTFTDARNLAAKSGHEDLDDDSLWGVVETLLAITDRVQQQGYGHDTPIDRTAPSYTEAAQWVKLTAEDVIADGQAIPVDSDGRDEWADVVVEHAVDRFSSVRDRAGSYLQARGARPARPSAQTPATPAPNPAFSPAVLKGLADSATAFAGNAKALTNLAGSVTEKGQAEVKLAVKRIDGKVQIVVADTLQDATGWHIDNAMNILRVLHNEASAQAAPNSTPEAPAQAPAATVASSPQAAPTAEPANQTAVEPQQAPTAAPAAPAAATRSNTPMAKSLLTQLGMARTLDAVQTVWETAKNSNILDETIAARIDESGAVTFAPLGTPGYDDVSLAQAVDKVRTFVTNGAAPAAPQPQPTAPAAPAAPTPAAAPSSATLDNLVARAQAATTLDELGAIQAEVQTAGFLQTPVVVGGQNGLFGQYLMYRIGALRETPAAAAS